MKKLLIIGITLICSCGHEKERNRKFEVSTKHGNSIMNEFVSSVRCDSFQMIDTSHVNVWIDGRKMLIIGNDVSVRTVGIQ